MKQLAEMLIKVRLKIKYGIRAEEDEPSAYPRIPDSLSLIVKLNAVDSFNN